MFWSRRLVIRSIRALAQSEIRINSYRIQRDFDAKTSAVLKKVTGKYVTGSALHQRGQYYFGTWNKALEAAGVDPTAFPKEHFWTEDKFRRAILALHRAGIPLHDSHIRENRSVAAKSVLTEAIGREVSGRSLFLAARHHLGSWERGIRLAGLEPSRIRKRGIKLEVDRKSLTQILLILSEEKLPINRAAIKISNQIKTVTSKRLGRVVSGSSVLRASIREFGSWDAALLHSGFHLSDIRKRSNPCQRKQEIFIEIIRSLFQRNFALNPSSVGKFSKQMRLFNEMDLGCDVSGNSLRNTAKALFGSWDRALWAAGLNPAEICLRRESKTANLSIIPHQIEDTKSATGEWGLTKYFGMAPKSPESILEDQATHELLQDVVDDFDEAERAQVEMIFDEILNIHHYRDRDQLIDFLTQKFKGSISREQIVGHFSRLTKALAARGATV